jgi:poly(A)-specific ribonuclease
MKSVARLAPALAVCDSHMDVLRANFNDSLPAVRDAIAAADFIAVDCEFTGLSPTDGADRSTRFDLPDDRFDRAARSVANFALIQFGVSVFNFDQDSKQLTAKLFDFYCFPRGFETWNEKRFLCQVPNIHCVSTL